MASFGDMIAQAFNQQPERKIFSDIGYDATKPVGGGKNLSSRVAYEPWQQWATNNLQNMEGAPSAEGITPDALEQYLAAQRSPTQAADDAGISKAFAGFMNNQRAENAPYLPTLVTGADGQQYVRYNQPEKPKGGFLDKISPMVENALALSGFAVAGLAAGAGAAGAGAGALEGAGAFGGEALGAAANAAGAYGGSVAPWITSGAGALGAGVTDLPWGVNQQTGASMFDEAGFIDFGEGFNSLGEVLRDVSIPGNGLTGIPNLQEIITKLDMLPPGTGKLAKTALGRLLKGQGGADDWASIAGALGATGLGVLGSNRQSDALTQIANQSRADRQPFLNQSLQWLNDPASFYAGAPAQAAMKGVLQGLSVNGNPANNPTALAMASDAGLRNWQNAVTGFGNIGLSGQDSRNALLSGAATADRGVTASLASGLGSLTQPDNSLESMLRRLQTVGLA